MHWSYVQLCTQVLDMFLDQTISLGRAEDCRHPAWWLDPPSVHFKDWTSTMSLSPGTFVSIRYWAWKPSNESTSFSVSSIVRWSKNGKYRDHFQYCEGFSASILAWCCYLPTVCGFAGCISCLLTIPAASPNKASQTKGLS